MKHVLQGVLVVRVEIISKPAARPLQQGDVRDDGVYVHARHGLQLKGIETRGSVGAIVERWNSGSAQWGRKRQRGEKKGKGKEEEEREWKRTGEGKGRGAALWQREAHLSED
jgi:hypothetical protein